MRDPEVKVGFVASAAALEEFAASAEADARRLVVGALVADDGGRIYLQRRSLTRELFPGRWDLVGGHAEAGESVLQALARELAEETGWQLTAVGPVVELLDWEAGGTRRREIDLLVRAAGDLERPHLEQGKHDQGRWFGPAALPLLEVDPHADPWTLGVVARGFQLLRSWRPSER
ncbi:MAG: NUDIX domain-containing protein [Trueperaceae bacterium]|nr:NUDIX domain-containing protein [Truepera sp.]HRN17437.1 NUDIX domain-containing protein [Trueperaceae bacterium]HRQ09838.1 NUDIX domain-containing protein [Trueperaceae bacterium]